MGEVFPEAKYQRCTVHFYCNVFSVTPRSKVKLAAKMLKAIHAQESRKAAREKAKAVVEGLCSMKLKEAAKKVEDGIEETLTYCDFPSEHWTRIRTNNVIERLNQEIQEYYLRDMPRTPRKTLYTMYRTYMAQYRLKESVGSSRAQVMYWYGEKEMKCVKNSARMFQQLLPSCRIYEAKGYGHGYLSVYLPEE